MNLVTPGVAAPVGDAEPLVPDLPPVWKFDDQVSADLSARWAGVDEDDVLLKDFVRSMAGAGGALLVPAGLMSMVIGYGHLWVALCCMVFGVGALLAVRHSHRRDRLASRAVSAPELDLVLEHRSLVDFSDWTHLPFQDLPREVAAARRARALDGELRALPAWTSDALDAHRLQLDPVEESRLLQIACREIFDHRVVLESWTAEANGRPTPVMLAAGLEWEDRLEQSWTAVQDRLSAFGDYIREVREVSILIEAEEAGRRLQGALLEYEPVMTVRIVAHEMARDNLERLIGDVGILREGLAVEPISGRGGHSEPLDGET